MITEIKRYETFDGLEFNNWDDAYRHEVETRDAFKNVFFYNVEHCFHMFDVNMIPKFEFMRDRLAKLSSTAS